MQVGPVQGTNNLNGRVKVRVQLNMNGIVIVEYAAVSIISFFHQISNYLRVFFSVFTSIMNLVRRG